MFEGVVCVLINFVFRLNDGKIKKKIWAVRAGGKILNARFVALAYRGD